MDCILWDFIWFITARLLSPAFVSYKKAPDRISPAPLIEKEPGDDLPYRDSIHKVFYIHYQENADVRFPAEPYQGDAADGHFPLRNVQGVLYRV